MDEVWAEFIIELVTCMVCGQRLPGGQMQRHAASHAPALTAPEASRD